LLDPPGHSRKASPGDAGPFAASPLGTEAVFASLSESVGSRRAKMRSGEPYDKWDLFEGDKSAEQAGSGG